jgi:hypothetical protein
VVLFLASSPANGRKGDKAIVLPPTIWAVTKKELLAFAIPPV